MLKFEPDKHAYTWEGQAVPSVTQVLGEFVRSERGPYSFYVSTFTGQAINASDFEAGQDHGTAIHEAVRIIMTGRGLDWDALHPDLVSPLNQFMDWLKHNPEAADSVIEQPIYSAKLHVAGTPDIVYPTAKTTRIIDIKTGGYSLAGPQTAAYAELWRDFHGLRVNARFERFALYLPKDGSQYKFIKLTDTTDLHFFKARLYTYQWLKNRR